MQSYLCTTRLPGDRSGVDELITVGNKTVVRKQKQRCQGCHEGLQWSASSHILGSLRDCSAQQHAHPLYNKPMTRKTSLDGLIIQRCHLADVRKNNRNNGTTVYRHSLCVDTGREVGSLRALRAPALCLQRATVSNVAVSELASGGRVESKTIADSGCLSDLDDLAEASARPRPEVIDQDSDVARDKTRNKLTRRKACYRQKKDGRSRSLTQIDSLQHTMSQLARRDSSVDHLSEPETMSAAAMTGTSVPADQLSRNLARMGSSEYFTLSFDIAGRSGDLPAVQHVTIARGSTLREALSGVCEALRIDLDSVNVYVDRGCTPLPPLTTDTGWLAGRHLRLAVRDQESKSPVRSNSTSCHIATPVRKSSGSYRGMVSKLMSGSSEEPALTCSAATSVTAGGAESPAVVPVCTTTNTLSESSSLKVAKSSSAKQHTRWSGIFSGSFNKDSSSVSKMDVMVSCLDVYAKYGVPRLAQLTQSERDAREEYELYTLERDWRELVDNVEQLDEFCQQQQNAIWELVHTEAAHILTLRVIIDLFMSCLYNLQAQQLLTEIDTDQLFSNIQHVYAASRHFWRHHVLLMVNSARQARAPLDITLMEAGFNQFEEIFHPYTRFCLDQTSIKLYCKTVARSNALFNGYLAWCETQKDCNRLRLVDILAKPWQRLTKYSLLLKAVLKKTTQSSQEISLTNMIHNVDVFVASVNVSLRCRHERDLVNAITDRIDCYDCVDTKDDELEKLVKQQSGVDLQCQMSGCSPLHRRQLILEGDLKLRDNVCSKMEVRCYLFTDMLLICKPLTKKSDSRMRVVRAPCVIDKLVVQASSRDNCTLLCVSLTEYRTAAAAFTLICADHKHLKVWLDGLKKAQQRYREARLDSVSHGYSLLNSGGSGACEFDVAVRVGDDDDADDVDDDDEELELTSSHPIHHHHHYHQLSSQVNTSLRGSSRSSRVPSLIHSHSSSVDNSEMYGTVRAMVAGSGDSTILCGHVNHAEDRCAVFETAASSSADCKAVFRHRTSLSPRRDRRNTLRSISSTPNQLSVTSHLSGVSGQSMPNLLTAEGSTIVHSASVDTTTQRPLSPTHRGISYPPPSPRLQRRPGVHVERSASDSPSSRNPPLVRAKHVTTPPPHHTGVTSLVSAAGQLAAAAMVGVCDSPCPVLLLQNTPDAASEEASGTVEAEDQERSEHVADLRNRTRHCRERQESRRYHTAGVIDDMKRQEVRDTAIHKRLSWNCGQQRAAQSPAGSVHGTALSGRPGCSVNMCLREKLIEEDMKTGQSQPSSLPVITISSDSIQSSSGVSSVNSLHLSSVGSDTTDQEPCLDTNHECDERRGGDVVAISSRVTATPRANQHVTTTYISVEGGSGGGVACVSAAASPPRLPVCNTLQAGSVKIDLNDSSLSGHQVAVETSDLLRSRVQIQVNSGDDSATENSRHYTATSALHRRQFSSLMADENVESADV